MALNAILAPRVLVVDDDATHRKMVSTWLRHTGYQPVPVGGAVEAIAALQAEPVDVVVTDLAMPGIDGLQLQRILEEIAPGLPVIFLTGSATREDAIAALRGGRAFDFLLKPLPHMRALNAAIEGAIARRLNAAPPAPAPAPAAAPHQPLTDTELRLVGLLAEGFDNQRIADDLCFSEKTVRNYLSRVYGKLGVTGRLQAVAASRRLGLVR